MINELLGQNAPKSDYLFHSTNANLSNISTIRIEINSTIYVIVIFYNARSIKLGAESPLRIDLPEKVLTFVNLECINDRFITVGI